MVEDERYQTIGRAVEQYGDNRRKIAALTHQAHELGGVLSELGEYLTGFGRESTNFSDAEKALRKLSAFDSFKELMNDIEQTLAERQRLASILRDAGVTPKD